MAIVSRAHAKKPLANGKPSPYFKPGHKDAAERYGFYITTEKGPFRVEFSEFEFRDLIEGWKRLTIELEGVFIGELPNVALKGPKP